MVPGAVCIAVLTFLLLAAAPVCAAAEEGVTWDRLRLSAKLLFAGEYRDNIYLETDGPRGDFVAAVRPTLGAEYGLFEGARLKLEYAGEFSSYGRFDNFGGDSHRLGLRGSWQARGESRFSVGAAAHRDSVQPYDERDQAKPFTETRADADLLLKVGIYTDLGLACTREARGFRDGLYARDEYTRQTVSTSLFYKRFDPNTLFVGYTFLDLENNDDPGVSTGWQSHRLEVGLRWAPAVKLSGRLQAGYDLTNFNDGRALNDLAVDTDLVYRLSEVLSLKIAGARQLAVSTSAARESGDYHVSTAARFSADYRPWESLGATLGVSYERKKFAPEAAAAPARRTDQLLGGAISLEYAPREWFGLRAGYRHARNISPLPAEEYSANILEMGLSLAL